MGVERRRRLTAGALVAGALGLATAAGGERRAAPGTVEVEGLRAEVEILTDRWGVPHIYAASAHDTFLAQGYQAARDRLWQIDLWRKRGLGEMARDFGPAYVEGDLMARAFLYRGDMSREWLAYGADAERIAAAFVAGVNAFVAETETSPGRLPVEFRLLGYRPARWSAADVVRIRHHGPTLNFTSEVERAAAMCAARGAPRARWADWLRRELVPPVEPVVPDGLDVCSLPSRELKRSYGLATSRPRFTPDAEEPYAVAGDDRPSGAFGSNNWTIAPRRTTTGRPILANDPHRAHGAPSLRYVSHLVAPGLDVIGAGEPFLPGISIGHNGTIAFGLTRFYIDQEDLYVYDLDPRDPGAYRYAGGFERMTEVRETVAVKDGPPRTAALKFTRHGPVLLVDAAGRRAYALRAAWLEPGMAPYFASIDYMRARNWGDFRAAMKRWGPPGENQVYADAAGNIGWIPAGLTPIRANWDGLLPVPGDGRYEWSGFRDRDELPSEYNPPRGYVVTANENNIPPDHPAFRKGIGYEWSDGARARRLGALFARADRFSLEDSERMQNDVTSTHAQRLVKLVQGLRSDDPRVAAALQALRAWDGHESPASGPAALFQVWLGKHLRPAVLRSVVGEVAAKAVAPGDTSRVITLLERPADVMTTAERDAILLSSLGAAAEELAARLGPDRGAWTWGALHQAVFEHPLRAVADAATAAGLDVGRWPLGGSSFTPMAASYRAADFTLTSGASFRMVLDVGGWDESRAINAPGQSGDPASPHYRDLAPLWAEGRYFPLLYTRGAVEKAAESRLLLRPRSRR